MDRFIIRKKKKRNETDKVVEEKKSKKGDDKVEVVQDDDEKKKSQKVKVKKKKNEGKKYQCSKDLFQERTKFSTGSVVGKRNLYREGFSLWAEISEDGKTWKCKKCFDHLF